MAYLVNFPKWLRSTKLALAPARTLSLVALILTASNTHALALDVGGTAPDFSLAGATKTVKMAEFKGRVVYLDFWASWCGPCKQSFPFMNAMQSKYGAHGLDVIAINVDSKASDATAFLTKVPATFTVAFDPQGSTPKLYKVAAMPSSYLISRDGKVLKIHKGFKQDDVAEIEKSIAQALVLK